MNSPINGKKMPISEKEATLVIDGIMNIIKLYYYECDSGEMFTTEALDDINLSRIYDTIHNKNSIKINLN